MAKITISSLSIENLGPFRERQTLDLSVTSGRPVVLVKALNGSGKTTLLTALQIGLYGHKAMDGLKRSEYEQLLLGLQRKDATGNAAVDISVTVEVGGSQRHLEVRREWHRRSDGLVEELSIFEGGSKDLEFSQTWDEFIGSILPAELVQLFLFDGEKIEELANPERLPDLLRRATEVFLGIGGIDALGNDLKALERRAALKNKNTSAEFESARSGLGEWEQQVKVLEAKVQTLTQEQGAAKNDAEQAQVLLDKFTNDAQRRGLTAYEQAAVIRNAVVASKDRVDAARGGLAEIMADPVLPIAWLSKLWTQYSDAWDQDQHARHSKLLGQEFKKRDQRVMSAIAAVAPKAALDALRKALADDLQAYTRSRTAAVPPLQDANPRDVERQLKDATSRLGGELSRLQSAQVELDKAEQRIGQIPAEEQIGEILKLLQDKSKAASAAEARLAGITERLEEAQSNLAHTRMRLNAAQERLGTEFRDRSLEAKSLDASSRARRALMIFKDRLLASKAQWLSEMITTEFRNLLRKRNLIAKVVVDPKTYRVFIEDGKHQELPMDRLSAGERQLLAISVLSALIKERKGRFPVVVDTPLARLDQQHRSALIKRFFATVSHQVVVLSTDQEVDGPAYDALKPFTNAEYTLDYDDAAGRTSIHAAQPPEAN
ncbi:DNA sulfur modification protein DndD [Paucibacter sp. PLA-PC-4]|uniref:DNA sulfur modification protein DndD n=1 Tax=Paucibacter sp. PLA-PC-4 TaxID=2993655 RepID=UPI00224ABA4C|nr:DNA sulfur modification protein DndD [Paucibacter sp. PLA-PC-4]MCX2864176.1 DNA sulfur modification protein DndD [Paucibacter sp. PLA-PC-4]